MSRSSNPGRPARSLLVLALASVLGVSACSGGTIEGLRLVRSEVARAATDPGDAAAAGAALAAFGADLFRSTAGEDPNVVISPASVALALAMARAGAKGVTAAEMDAVLHELTADAHPGWLNALDAALADRTGRVKDANGDEQEVTLRIANTAFAQDGLPLQQGYLDRLAGDFGAGVYLVDYVGATETARRAINAWVKERTEERIPELLAKGVISPDTLLTLVDAIYLKAAWETPFPEKATSDGTFTRLDGSTVTVPFMHLVSGLGYASGAGWRAVELPYVGGTLAMTLILPDDPAAFVAGLDGTTLSKVVSGLTPAQVTLALPRFSAETKVELSEVLQALGMPTAFDGAADFSGITTAADLEISAVVHQANIDVDEKGTVAAAATAVVMRETSIPGELQTVVFDRPFLFLLRDVPTGATLFVGRVGDPSAGR